MKRTWHTLWPRRWSASWLIHLVIFATCAFCRHGSPRGRPRWVSNFLIVCYGILYTHIYTSWQISVRRTLAISTTATLLYIVDEIFDYCVHGLILHTWHWMWTLHVAGIDILLRICHGFSLCVRLPTSSDHPWASRLARVRAISWHSWLAAASSSWYYYYSDMAILGYKVATHLDICVLLVCRTLDRRTFAR